MENFTLELLHSISITVDRIFYNQTLGCLVTATDNAALLFDFSFEKSYEFNVLQLRLQHPLEAVFTKCKSTSNQWQLELNIPKSSLPVESRNLYETETERIFVIFAFCHRTGSIVPLRTLLKERLMATKKGRGDSVIPFTELVPFGTTETISEWVAFVKEEKQENGKWKFVNMKLSELTKMEITIDSELIIEK
jgi:hypothetical protein